MQENSQQLPPSFKPILALIVTSLLLIALGLIVIVVVLLTKPQSLTSYVPPSSTSQTSPSQSSQSPSSSLSQPINQKPTLPLTALTNWKPYHINLPASKEGFIIPAVTITFSAPVSLEVKPQVDPDNRCFSVSITEPATRSRLNIKKFCDGWSGKSLPLPPTATLIDDYWEYGEDNETHLTSLYRINDSNQTAYYGTGTRFFSSQNEVGTQYLTAKASFEKAIIIPVALGINVGKHHLPMEVIEATIHYGTTNKSQQDVINLIFDKVVHNLRITQVRY